MVSITCPTCGIPFTVEGGIDDLTFETDAGAQAWRNACHYAQDADAVDKNAAPVPARCPHIAEAVKTVVLGPDAAETMRVKRA